MMRAAAALLTVLAVACGGSPATPPPTTAPSPASEAPAAVEGAPGPAFSGTYAMTAVNVGTEGEPTFAATWTATPRCSSGMCDADVEISRPGFETYTVRAKLRGGAWTWAPVPQFACPGSGAVYEVASGGFRMEPRSGGAVARRLDGTVRVRLVASGCKPIKLSYEVTARRGT